MRLTKSPHHIGAKNDGNKYYNKNNKNFDFHAHFLKPPRFGKQTKCFSRIYIFNLINYT